MKQLLFLLLFPCLCVAQYTGNAGQKITLGEQTTADGLVYRGVLADTGNITPFSDTSAYIILDTVNNRFYNYNRNTNVWTQAGGSTFDTTTLNLVSRFALKLNISDTSSMLTNYYRSGRALGTPLSGTLTNATGLPIIAGTTGTLSVSRGGTNASTFTAGSVVFAGTSGTSLTQDNSYLFFDNSNKRLGIGTSAPIQNLDVRGNAAITGFGSYGRNVDGTYKLIVLGQGTTSSTYALGVQDINGINLLLVRDDGNVAINVASPTEKLHVVGNARITGAYNVTTASAANVFVTSDGVLQRSTSSIKYKTDVEDYSKGLKEVMQLRPVTFKSINSNNDKTYAGFIAEELADLKLNELVENNDSGEPDAISYAYMVTLLTKAIQEQQEQISLLKKRLLILENK